MSKIEKFKEWKCSKNLILIDKISWQDILIYTDKNSYLFNSLSDFIKVKVERFFTADIISLTESGVSGDFGYYIILHVSVYYIFST